MVATGRVRDRALARGRASGDGGNDFFRRRAALASEEMTLARREKWWGPVVLDAAPKPPSDLDFLRE